MRSVGWDLSDYNTVSEGAYNIFARVSVGNMPPGRPWSPAMVETFKTWIQIGCPKGTEVDPNRRTPKSASGQVLRVRKEITQLSSAEVSKLTTAFKGLMARDKDPTAENSYFKLAGIHGLPQRFCQHHIPGFNPWHRAYILIFEDALRSVEGCEDVTLPYWDFRAPVPDLLYKPPFNAYTLPEPAGDPAGIDVYAKGYVTKRNPVDKKTKTIKRM